MNEHPRAKRPVAIHAFTREQVVAQDWAAFVAAYPVEGATPEALRETFDSVVIKLSGVEAQPRAVYALPEARAFLRDLHEKWPYGFFFLNLSAADLTSYVFSRLSTLSIEQRSAGGPPKVGYSRNELFQIVGRDLEPLEKACQRAGFTAGEYRNRSRRILKLFSFLKK